MASRKPETTAPARKPREDLEVEQAEADRDDDGEHAGEDHLLERALGGDVHALGVVGACAGARRQAGPGSP